MFKNALCRSSAKSTLLIQRNTFKIRVHIAKEVVPPVFKRLYRHNKMQPLSFNQEQRERKRLTYLEFLWHFPRQQNYFPSRFLLSYFTYLSTVSAKLEDLHPFNPDIYTMSK